MILLYIDPGTGSMLFGILVAVIGALTYLVRSLIMKLRFVMSGGRAEGRNEHKLSLVIFSDDKRYWPVFEPVCRELDRRGMDTVYMTASKNDPGLSNSYEHIKGEFIGEGNKAFARLNLLNAYIVLSTTPGLDVYQWKRSRYVDHYVHMLHGPNEIAGYRMFGIDYYDALLLSGEYQVNDARNLEKIRNLPEKEIVLIGIPYMDEMVRRLESSGMDKEHERTVLLAPTWGESSIFNRFGGRIIEILRETGYQIIIRPHPQSFTSEAKLMGELMSAYPESDRLHWNRDVDNFETLRQSDILISDFSGVTLEFALVFDRPVIYADTEYDSSPYDTWWLDTPFWTLGALERIGMKLTEDNVTDLKEMIDDCIENPRFASERGSVRNETWIYPGEGASRAADYLISKYDELTRTEEM
ncbi:MAG: CDP-glycerol glycerophosphotransferase family protein [Lachnospiraceae bacterium]|nr:CDP-glycerol glycerophosphotransferase family protein [Lachnospiraceae bacterium]